MGEERLERPKLPSPVQGGQIKVIIVGDKKVTSPSPNVKVEKS